MTTTTQRVIYLALAVACAVGAYLQLRPRIDCAQLNYKYFAPAPQVGRVPLAPPPMTREKCEQTAATFKTRGIDVPMVPLAQRRGWAVFALSGLVALVLALRRRPGA